MTAAAAVAVALVGTLAWLALLAGPFRLATGLLAARGHLDEAERALENASLKRARFETLAAVAAAERARGALGAPLLDVARMSARVGLALDEIGHLVAAGEHSAAAARGTLDIAQNALKGPDKLIVKDEEDPDGGSRVRIERITEIAGTIAEVRRHVRSTASELAAVDVSALPRRARPAIAKGIRRAAEADEVLADAQAGFAVLPDLLGAGGARTYMLAMQNPAELRGTGGSLLQFAFMRIEDGKPHLSQERRGTIYRIDRDRRQLEIPLPDDAWYVRGVPDAQRAGNANWSPDWPLSARLTVEYAHAADATLPPIDGVFLVDPMVLRNLLPGVGSFRTKWENLISVKTSVHFLLYKAYARYPIAAVRRKALRQVVDGFYRRVLRPDYPTELVEGMGRSLASNHMRLWLAEPREQAFVERMNWDGGIEEARGADYLYVVQQNVGGNKLNYFEQQEHSTDVRIEGDDAVHTTDVSIHNGLFQPQTRYYLGDSGPIHKPMVNVYAPSTAVLTRWDEPQPVRVDHPFPIAAWVAGRPPEHLELGKKVWSATVEIPQGAEGHVGFDYRVPDVVREEDGRKVYRLVVQHQPKVHAETLTVRLRLPEGARAVSAPGWERRGPTLVWERKLERDVELEVSWRE